MAVYKQNQLIKSISPGFCEAFDLLKQKRFKESLQVALVTIDSYQNQYEELFALWVLGRTYHEYLEHKKSTEYFSICKTKIEHYKVIEKYSFLYGSCHLWLGLEELVKGNRVEAFKLLLKAKKHHIISPAPNWLELENTILTYYCIGVILYEFRYLEESDEYCEFALKFAETYQNAELLGRILTTMGNIAKQRNTFDEAMGFYLKALEYKQQDKDPLRISVTHINIAEVEFNKKNYEKVLFHTNLIYELQSQYINRKNQNFINYLLARSHYYSSAAHTKLGNTDKAWHFQLQALDKADKTNHKHFKIAIYQCMVNSYREQGNYKEAYTYTQKIVDIQSTILNNVTDKQIADIRINFHRTDKQESLVCFTQQLEQLQSANHQLERFTSTIAHDIRSPLSSIIRYLGLFKRRNPDIPYDDAMEYINSAIEVAKGSYKLADNLLNITNINKKNTPFETVDLNVILERVLLNLSHEIEDRNACIKVGDLPTLELSQGLIVQLFQNLISNAIKYNDSSHPIVEISAENIDGTYCFSVRDNGIGIAQKYREQIFQMMQRLHSDGEYEGHGLGLSICASVVKKHGGKIWIESNKNKGSCFKFTIATNKAGDE